MEIVSRLLVLFGALTLCTSVQASTVLFDNTFLFPDGQDLVASVGPLYDSFSTGANSGFLSNAEFLLSGDATSSGSISVDLYTDSGILSDMGASTVGSFIINLGTIADSQLSAVPSVVAVNLVSNPALAPNMRYWIGLTGPNSTAGWAWTLDTTSAGIGSENEFFQNTFDSFPNSDGGYQMEVEVSSASSNTPEPASLLLSGVALVTCSIALRRRARR